MIDDKRTEAKRESKTRLRSEIVDAMRGLHKIGAVGEGDLQKTMALMLPETRR